MLTLRGWTVDNYASAAAWYYSKFKELPPIEHAAKHLKFSWTRPFPPGESPIVGVDQPDPEPYFDFACEIFDREAL